MVLSLYPPDLLLCSASFSTFNLFAFNNVVTQIHVNETKYHIVQNSDGVKLWQIGNFRNLVGKTLANCNKLSLHSSIKNTLLAHPAKLKTTTVY